MNKKIISELAIGIILILAVMIWGIIFIKNEQTNEIIKQSAQKSAEQAKVEAAQVEQKNVPVPQAAQAQSQPSGQIPKSYSDENVDWLPAPAEVTDVQLFKKNTNHTQFKIWETGTVKNGEFAGGRVLLVIVESDDLGPTGPGIFRFVQKKEDGQLYFLKDYSNMDFFNTFTDDNNDWQDVNKKLFSYMGQNAYDLNITGSYAIHGSRHRVWQLGINEISCL